MRRNFNRTLKVTGLFGYFSFLLKDIYEALGMHNIPSLRSLKLSSDVRTRLGPIKKPLSLIDSEFNEQTRIHLMQL